MIKDRRRVFPYFFLGLVFFFGAAFSWQNLEKPNSSGPAKTEKIAAAISAQPILETNLPFAVATIKAKRDTEISSGVITTDKGDDLLVLVNKHIKLSMNYEPKDLVTMDGRVATTRPGLQLRREAADALTLMSTSSKADGVNLVVLSAYRSYWQQSATLQDWILKIGSAAAEALSAEPGHSQHQLGTAVDFFDISTADSSDQNFKGTLEGTWLAKNAYRFGFVLSYPKGGEAITGYVYEPWHYRYIGIENAKKMAQSGLILEEFLQKFGVV